MQRPHATETLQPGSFVIAKDGNALCYRSSEQWRVRLAAGHQFVRTLSPGRSFVYQDQGCLMVLDGGSSRPRLVFRSRLKAARCMQPAWSADARFMFHFFDSHVQLVAMEAATGACWRLTDYFVRRNYKRGIYFDPMILGPLVYDAAAARVVFAQQDYGSPWDFWLVGISLADGVERTLTKRIDLRGGLRQWAVDLATERAYTLTRGERVVRVWNFRGEPEAVIRSPDRAGVHRFALSPDGGKIILEPAGMVLDVARHDVIAKLPEGALYEWSPDGSRIAFLRGTEELYVYHVASKTATLLARILPRSDAPGWSRTRYRRAPAWSPDGHALAAGLGTYAGGTSLRELTMLFELDKKRVVILPCGACGMSWSPVPNPFPQGLRLPGKEAGAGPGDP